MDNRLINRRDLAFQLYEVLEVQALTQRARYADHSRETFEAAIDTALRIALDHFASHNRKADEQEPRFDGERVHLIPEVAQALKAFCDAGLMAAARDYDQGGMQLPVTVAQALLALFNAANVSTAAYPFLTIANANLIAAFGSEEQRRLYLPPLLDGRFLGTMALTEPQAGSSLADLRTSAVPDGPGRYRITGNKIYISAGDHDLSENIIHLVLARLRGAPPGVRGISLFIVPKYLLNEDGSLAERNDVTLAGLLHKMGYRGTTSTVLNFGERGGAVGYLVGEANQGLRYMFHMMNEARIGVGLGAAMLGLTGYLHALAYARERLQGRPPGAKDPAAPPVRIIEHADVRRMLLAQKAAVEGAVALCLYAARLVDDQQSAPAPAQREEARMLLEVLTPVVKAWPSEYCLRANALAIQVHGGAGYTRDFPVEQFYRDNRLNPIHEGTNGIQGLDLLGRKLALEDGKPFALLLARLGDGARAAVAQPALQTHGEALARAAQRLASVSELLRGTLTTDPAQALANASVYLEATGHVVIAWMWLRQALVALAALPGASAGDGDFYRGKLAACQYFFRYELPEVHTRFDLLASLDRTCLDMDERGF